LLFFSLSRLFGYFKEKLCTKYPAVKPDPLKPSPRKLSGRPIISKPFNHLVILLESTNGFHRGLEQHPTENKDSYGKPDLPWPRRLWAQPNQGQRQRPHTTDCHDNERLSEIPLNLFLCKAWVAGAIQKLAAVFTLDRVVLDVLSAEGTLFHYHLS
jgi:hypothetical protein